MDEPQLPVSPRTMGGLIVAQGVLQGLTTIAGVTILADLIGAKTAALFVIIVQGVGVTLGFIMSRAVVQAVSSVENVVEQAMVATGAAEDATARMNTATRRLDAETERRQNR